VLTALGLEPAAAGEGGSGGEEAAPEALRRLRFTEEGRAAIRGAVVTALNLGHNYIGTEHLLLGILHAKGDAGQILIGLGLTAGLTRSSLAEEFARIQRLRSAAG
jgi:ATP-dependent Clp protease ATP-binding subunit ClpA